MKIKEISKTRQAALKAIPGTARHITGKETPMKRQPTLALFLLSLLPIPAAAAELPEAISASDEIVIATVHAVGSQVYECKPDPSVGTLAWQFREPIATLFISGKTVGRHYAGPNWELIDGSAVQGKVAGRAPAASANDIPLLKLAVAARRGDGRLTDVTTIQRINTKGGVAEGHCKEAGAFLSVPYTADYTFLSKSYSRR
jgi:hypothetical protein